MIQGFLASNNVRSTLSFLNMYPPTINKPGQGMKMNDP